jgi:hypothetical protein
MRFMTRRVVIHIKYSCLGYYKAGGLPMARAERTVYRILKSNFSKEELSVYFSPTASEISWATQCARSLKSCLLVNLKVFQYLGYFPSYDEIPALILTQVQ